MISCILWLVVGVYLVGFLDSAAWAYFFGGGDPSNADELLPSIVYGLRWPLTVWKWIKKLKR